MEPSQPRISPIIAKLWPNGEHKLGPCVVQCEDCGALHWAEERAQVDVKKNRNKFSMCCQKGKVILPSSSVSAPKIPLFLERLYRDDNLGECSVLRLSS
jgi:hypothetical protein